MYKMAKHLHLTAVALSIILFILRFVWSQFNPDFLQKKWVKIVPHVIDTVLLGSALWLCTIISQYPFVDGWVTFKVIGVLAYIIMGMLALKWGRTVTMKWVGFIGALAWLAVTAKIAITKQVFFF